MMKKDTYFAFHPGGLTTPAIFTFVFVCSFVFVYFNRNLGEKETFTRNDWFLIVITSVPSIWFLFNTLWNIQWVRFEKDRIVLANSFSRNLKSIEYSDMEVVLDSLISIYADNYNATKTMDVPWICIYSKKYHPRRYKYGGCNLFGKHRMHIYYDHDVYEKLKKLAEENSKEGTVSSSS